VAAVANILTILISLLLSYR